MRCWAVAIMLLSCVASFCNAQTLYDHSIKPADTQPENYLSLLKNKRVALVINQTATVNNESLLDLLVRNKIDVRRVFVPEHGFRGYADAGETVYDSWDSATRVPIVSLYGNHKKPVPEELSDIEVMVYDLQDVGTRFYTYISTMQYCMEACAQNKVTFVVLDRPNPNGFYVDGPILESEFKSFVGLQPIPIVYGLTAGEYASMLVGERWMPGAEKLNLKIVPCINYSHAKKYELAVFPSPNLKSMTAVYAYPSMCLFEGTPLSLGRGTNFPFLQYGCPEFEGKFNYTFTPRPMPGALLPPHSEKVCYGELLGTDASEILAKTGTRLNLEWIRKAYSAYPDKSKFFFSFFMKLAGTAKLASQIGRNEPEEFIRGSWQDGLDKYKAIRKKYLLYPDFE